MTAADLHRWLRSWHADAQTPESVDRVIVGDPQTMVRGIAAVWMPSWQALRDAHARECNVVVAHEPTFYTHLDQRGFDEAFDRLPPVARAAVVATRQAKRQWIEQHGLVVIRCHDALDSMRGGIVDTLAAKLGFSSSDYVVAEPHYRVVRLAAAQTAEAVARRLAQAFGAIRQPGVAFYGDPHRLVRTLGLGTGYGCDPWRFVEMGADMALTIDDRVKTWTELAWADDAGYPLVVIHHGTSEEWGVQQMAALIGRQFPEIPTVMLEQGCTYRWITPDA